MNTDCLTLKPILKNLSMDEALDEIAMNPRKLFARRSHWPFYQFVFYVEPKKNSFFWFVNLLELWSADLLHSVFEGSVSPGSILPSDADNWEVFIPSYDCLPSFFSDDRQIRRLEADLPNITGVPQ